MSADAWIVTAAVAGLLVVMFAALAYLPAIIDFLDPSFGEDEE